MLSLPSLVEQLRKATSLKDLAKTLGVEPKQLSYILYIFPGPKYTTFQIPKKSGGTRVIEAPIDRLKIIQRMLADLLATCASEIDEQHKRKPISHGFRRGRSFLTNAHPHTNRRFVLNLDIDNFFPTINFGRVRGYFIKNKDFLLNEKVATVVAQIACSNQALPQGSPCSPIISDLIAHILDVRLVRLAKQHKCTYSRYADDLTFSTNQKEFPSSLATCSMDGSVWTLGEPLIASINNAGFSINAEKTRMQSRTSRQTVTGLVVNKKVNIRDEYFRAARVMCHSLFNTGSYHRPNNSQAISSTHQIEGILNYIDQTKTTSDSRDENTKRSEPLASHKLHRRLVFYKYFVVPDKALILCEGPSDSAYLKTAIQQLAPKYPDLIDATGGVSKLRVRFFSYRQRTSALLNLTGGTAPIKNFIETYEAAIGKYGHTPLPFPVIVLLDNDSGAKGIFSLINGKYKLNASLKTTGAFYAVCQNLYIIKTPEVGETGESKIEDCFESTLLETPFGGKMFNATDEKLGPNEFGKTALAGIVRAEAGKVVFAGFEPLLDRIVAALQHYQAQTVGET